MFVRLLYEAECINPQLPNAIEAFEMSITVQLIANKVFATGVPLTQDVVELTKADEGSWHAHGIAYNRMFQSHIEETNALPPNFIIQSFPNQPFNHIANSTASIDYNYGALSKLLTEVKTLSTKVCAVCGIDKKLQLCGRCKSVSYCSKSHQKEHWKQHKNECAVFCENPTTGPGDNFKLKPINPDEMEIYFMSKEGGGLPCGTARPLIVLCGRSAHRHTEDIFKEIYTENNGMGKVFVAMMCEKDMRVKIRNTFQKALVKFKNHPVLISGSKLYERMCICADTENINMNEILQSNSR